MNRWYYRNRARSRRHSYRGSHPMRATRSVAHVRSGKNSEKVLPGGEKTPLSPLFVLVGLSFGRITPACPLPFDSCFAGGMPRRDDESFIDYQAFAEGRVANRLGLRQLAANGAETCGLE